MTDSDDMGAGVYRQEAADLVAAIESGLMALERTPGDTDRINAVFRDLHTVKGSGAMFGFTEVAHFVHEFETAFDRLRRGEASVSTALIEVSLSACDQILRLMDDPATAAPQSDDILTRLQVILGGGAREPAQAPQGTAAPDAQGLGWRVTFRLAPNALLLGHNPGQLLDDLRALGPTQVRAQVEAIPALDRLDPTACLTGWVVEIAGDVAQSDIEAVFLFHQGDMDLAIAPLAPGGGADVPPAVATAPATLPAANDMAAPADTLAASTQPGQTMRVATERLDELMDRVGELVIAEARLQSLAHASRDPALLAVAEDIQRLSGGLRDSTMSIRMVPMSSILGRFRRLVRDLSGSLGKPLTFVTHGEDTELDKTVIELLADPLVHILRNSADHGLETAEERRAAGKPETGTIELSAEYAGAEVVITVRDDGRGLDPARIRARAIASGLITEGADLPPGDLLRLIFEPGFSTAAAVTEVSGRGVGMDVVKRTIAGLRGQIELSSEPGHGTTVALRLPLTLAIIDGMLVEVGGEHYTIPLAAVEECVELPPTHASLSGISSFLNIRGSLVPFLRLRSLFDVSEPASAFQKVVVVSSSGSRVGLVVDSIIGNNQTVIKQLSPLHAGLKSFSGATILGNGTVALILDVVQLVETGRALEDRARQERVA